MEWMLLLLSTRSLLVELVEDDGDAVFEHGVGAGASFQSLQTSVGRVKADGERADRDAMVASAGAQSGSSGWRCLGVDEGNDTIVNSMC